MIWHILTIAPQRESVVAAGLGRELGLKTFVPLEQFKARRNNKQVELSRPFIRGYVFAGCSGIMPWHEIKSTRHVHGWLTIDDDIPARVSDAEVNRMQRLADEHNRAKEQVRRGLMPGDRVTITRGPFANMTTLLATVRNDVATGEVSIFGRPTPVTVPVGDLERVA